ncbi:hypothetical protein SUGI_0491580 [Cryptomeria japonica]|uniref:U-box domain-containing protein 26 n=1 Tax=Cryptomeria japonica TaxID=3369 RepID=UPI002408C437|nr:U-box domain-containing protein 26 [Cryptomeria japonica]GLJ25664.1 hypothetical protein SUGI_0491580 [Cryptomeria japonica]
MPRANAENQRNEMATAAGRRELEITIPPFFTCPISLDLMKDPVSTCTGVTYDRASIEKWIDDGNATCPATLQPLVTRELIPNHTLRRLIQAWCGANAAKGVERVPTPKTPANSHTVRCLLREIQPCGRGESNGAAECRLRALRRIRALARDSVRNAICISDEGAADVLAAVLADGVSERAVCEEAVGILAVLPLDDLAKKRVGQVSVLAAVARLLACNLETGNSGLDKVGLIRNSEGRASNLEIANSRLAKGELIGNSESRDLEVGNKKVGNLPGDLEARGPYKKMGGVISGDLEALDSKVSKVEAVKQYAGKKKVGELSVEGSNRAAAKKNVGQLNIEASNLQLVKKKVGQIDVKAWNLEATKKKVGELSVQSSVGVSQNNKFEASNAETAKKVVNELPISGLVANNSEVSSLEASINAAELVERLSSDERILSHMSSVDGLIPGFVAMVHDPAQARAVKSAVRALAALCVVQRNRAQAIAAGIVDRLVAVLIEPDRGLDEACLCLLESLCRCAEGRAAVADHALAVPVIVKKMSRSSLLATEFAVGTLWSVCGHCQSEAVGRYAAESGVCAKLFWLLQVDCAQKAKSKAGDLIRLIHVTCKDCPCCYANACFENAGLLREE